MIPELALVRTNGTSPTHGLIASSLTTIYAINNTIFILFSRAFLFKIKNISLQVQDIQQTHKRDIQV